MCQSYLTKPTGNTFDPNWQTLVVSLKKHSIGCVKTFKLTLASVAGDKIEDIDSLTFTKAFLFHFPVQ